MSARRSAWHAPKPPAIVEAVVGVDFVSWDIAAEIESESLRHVSIDAEAVGREIANGWTSVESPTEQAAKERLHNSIRRDIAMALEVARLMSESLHVTAAQAIDAVASVYAVDRRIVARAFKHWPQAAPHAFARTLDRYRATA